MAFQSFTRQKGASRQCAASRCTWSQFVISACIAVASVNDATTRAAGFESEAFAGDVPSVVVGDPSASRQDFESSMMAMPSSGYPYATEGCNTECGGKPCRTHGTDGLINRVLGDACPRWTAQVDALMLWRGNVSSFPLLVENDGDFPTVLNANQIVPDMAVGPRAALLLHLDNEYAIEANYFYVGSISGTSSFNNDGVPPLYAFDFLSGQFYGDITDGVATSNASIQSFELNWRRRPCGHSITWLAGFRWIEWNESLAIRDNFTDEVTSGVDRLDSQTRNDLYGAQIGIDALLLNLYDTVRFNSVLKAGVYGNLNAESTVSVGGDRFEPSDFSATGDQVGFFGEIGINGAVRLSKHVFWRTGYNFFWINGVANAAQQYAVADVASDPPEGTIELGGSVFLHGVNTGIEVLW